MPSASTSRPWTPAGPPCGCNRTTPEAANNLGLALHALGRFAEAVAQFRAALEIRADFALAHNNLGTSLRELGQFGEALQAYRSAVALDPNLALARSNLGQMLVDQGQAEEGLPHCAEAVKLQPNVAAAHNNLGNAYRALERWSEAQAAYDEALRWRTCYLSDRGSWPRSTPTAVWPCSWKASTPTPMPAFAMPSSWPRTMARCGSTWPTPMTPTRTTPPPCLAGSGSSS